MYCEICWEVVLLQNLGGVLKWMRGCLLKMREQKHNGGIVELVLFQQFKSRIDYILKWFFTTNLCNIHPLLYYRFQKPFCFFLQKNSDGSFSGWGCFLGEVDGFTLLGYFLVTFQQKLIEER